MKARAAVTIGLAILGLATVFLITGRSAGATKPSVQDYGASGTSAWAELVRRDGYQVLENYLGGDGKCPSCGRRVAGIWAEKSRSTRRSEAAHLGTV